MIIGSGAHAYQLVDRNGQHNFQPFPSSSLTINMETYVMEGGATFSIPRSYDEGQHVIACQIWQADDDTARQMVEDLKDYLITQHVALRRPAPVVFSDGRGRAIADAVMALSTVGLSSVSAGFTLADQGKRIVVAGAGPYGGNLNTQIAAYVDAQHVNLSQVAGSAVAGVDAVITVNRYDGLWWIDQLTPALNSEFPGRIPCPIQMRKEPGT